VLEGTDIAYVARVATRRIMTVGITVGTRFPAYATSMGRVLLAGLPAADLKNYLAAAEIRPLTPKAIGTREELLAELAAVRAQGWCLLDQELELGLMSVAAPVHDGPKVVAAINVSLQAQSVAGQDDPDAYLDAVRKAAVATAGLISADLSGRR
jgi:IclR family transcriptional regulator, pca regulon regulatory protein